MSDDITECFRRMPWLKVKTTSPEIRCTICDGSIEVLPEVGMTENLNRLIEFANGHEVCGKKKEKK